MLAQNMRRRVSLFSLPVVVAIGVLVVTKFVAWHESDLVAELVDCVAHGNTREAIDAVHKLAAMPNPPIPPLVTAAAADEREIVQAGQLSINHLLRRWQIDIESKHREAAVASQLSELAHTLANKHHDFDKSDHAWLADTARKILAVADKFPSKQTPLVAAPCDAILTATADAGSLSPSVSNRLGLATKQMPPKISAITTTDDDGEGINDNGGRATVAFASQPARNDSDSCKDASNQHASENSSSAVSRTEAAESVLKFQDDAADTKLDSPATAPPEDTSKATNEATSGNASSSPTLRILPQMPADILPIERDVAKGVAANSRSARNPRLPPGASVPRGGSPSIADEVADEAFAKADSRELLRRWLETEKADIQPIERELIKRGFGRLTTQLVRRFLSDKPEERMRSMNDVLSRPGRGAGAWLLLLARDPDAEVRLFAVTLMATSSDSVLVEKAWQLAIRDRDPRIADLADRLRERREGTLRR